MKHTVEDYMYSSAPDSEYLSVVYIVYGNYNCQILIKRKLLQDDDVSDGSEGMQEKMLLKSLC